MPSGGHIRFEKTEKVYTPQITPGSPCGADAPQAESVRHDGIP